jgi:hypothetical protein
MDRESVEIFSQQLGEDEKTDTDEKLRPLQKWLLSQTHEAVILAGVVVGLLLCSWFEIIIDRKFSLLQFRVWITLSTTLNIAYLVDLISFIVAFQAKWALSQKKALVLEILL